MRAGVVSKKVVSLEQNKEPYRIMPDENTSMTIKAAKNVPKTGAYGAGVSIGIGDDRAEEAEAVEEHPKQAAPQQGGQHGHQRHAEPRLRQGLPGDGGDDAAAHPLKGRRLVAGRDELPRRRRRDDRQGDRNRGAGRRHQSSAVIQDGEGGSGRPGCGRPGGWWFSPCRRACSSSLGLP